MNLTSKELLEKYLNSIPEDKMIEELVNEVESWDLENLIEAYKKASRDELIHDYLHMIGDFKLIKNLEKFALKNKFICSELNIEKG